jgi:hypothetical protein
LSGGLINYFFPLLLFNNKKAISYLRGRINKTVTIVIKKLAIHWSFRKLQGMVCIKKAISILASLNLDKNTYLKHERDTRPKMLLGRASDLLAAF